ncbi:MAG: hypothetical protein AAF915_02420 [Cyanobacteria bacterium P01_D01_bin.50]
MKRVILFFCILYFILNPTNVYAASISGNIDYILPKCEEIDRAQLQMDLNSIVERLVADETKIDFGTIVNREWHKLNLDSIIDDEVDNAVDTISRNTNWINKFKSSWNPSKAEELTNEVAGIAFNSSVLQNKLEQVSKNVSSEISNKLEIASAKSSSYAIDCLQKFINRQYSQTFVNIFNQKIKASVPDYQEYNGLLKTNTVSIINQHKFGFVGGAVIALAVTKKISQKITKTISTRIFSQVSERILGRIGGAFIPVVGEVVGGLMIAGDIYNSRNGALPEIKKSLKSLEVKQIFRQEIANQVESEVSAESPQIAMEVSNGIYAEWLDFQKDYRETLSLAEELPEFKSILAKTTDVSKISLLVGTALNNTSRSQLVESIQDGTFEEALSLPEISYKILENTHSLPLMLKWGNLAGNKIKDVVELEIYKQLSVQDLNRQLLVDIISLQDSTAIAKISLLDIDSYAKLLTISKYNVVSLAEKLTVNDLQKLAGYLGELNQPQINQLVIFLLKNDPSIINNSDIMADIIHSGNLNAAIKFWEKPRNLISSFNGILQVFTGAISWQLFFDRYGIFATVLIILVPLFLIGVFIFWIYDKIKKLFSSNPISSE